MKKIYRRPIIEIVVVSDGDVALMTASRDPGTGDGFGKENNFDEDDEGDGNEFSSSWKAFGDINDFEDDI